ncbi:hypothetical protein AK812_SmicGene39368 [Symbiodinium microadriaticum]|uniref:Uncharacterized protein n=1 Tax=Symbiodinium microadriaticum TaxID=2951 RepID=A0A1Q9CBD8_SYMMI|nr:hypothetical protein AK812_SmicGene39368 [Symbiodinium microadriaticum]
MHTSFRAEEGGQDGSLTFDEACGQLSGMKLQGPERRPLKSIRAVGNVDIGDLPVRQMESSSAKVEQFADAIMYYPLDVTQDIFDNIYKFYGENKFAQLPEPFDLKNQPKDGDVRAGNLVARSYKRCLLLGTMSRALSVELEKGHTSTWSIAAEWRSRFAAVITGMWPDGKDCSSVAPCVGVYPADLGPDDIALSRFCYGEFDPTLTISGFPFETKEFGACVVDYVADFACNLLAGLGVPSNVVSISEGRMEEFVGAQLPRVSFRAAFKREYCNSLAADFDRLRRAFYAKMKADDPSYPRRCLWRTLAEGNKGGVYLG